MPLENYLPNFPKYMVQDADSDNRLGKPRLKARAGQTTTLSSQTKNTANKVREEVKKKDEAKVKTP